MKVAVVSVSSKGGAGIAAQRLHLGFLKDGIDSSFLTQSESDGKNVFSAVSYFGRFSNVRRFLWMIMYKLRARKFIRAFVRKLNDFSLFSAPFGEFPLHLHPAVANAEVVNLHWVSGFLDLPAFMRSVGKPIVLTLHDTYFFTGGCHYPGQCEGYKEHCSQCPVVPVDVADLVSSLHGKKSEALANPSVHVVGISKWITQASMVSSLLGKRPHHTIPNGLNPAEFIHHERDTLKKDLDVPLMRRCILMVAQDLGDVRKGGEFIKPLIEHPLLQEVSILLVGQLNTKLEGDNVISFGQVIETEKLNQIYQVADLYIHLAVQDNFPNTVLEALFNGCPIVGFRIGGVPDMVTHSENGFLVDEISVEAMAATISTALNSEVGSRRERIANSAKERFNIERQTQAYSKLFETITSR